MTTQALLDGLSALLGPKGLVREEKAMAAYQEETRGLYTGCALAVAKPISTAEVSEILKLCAQSGVPIVAQGGNTGLVGGAVPDNALVLSLERMNRIETVDVDNLTMRLVQQDEKP